jgi:hypothetical protein
MTNLSHRTNLRAALRDDHAPAGREAVLARSFWANAEVGLATVVSFAEASRARHERAGQPPAASSGAVRAASRGRPRTP